MMKMLHRLLNMCKVWEEKTGFQLLNLFWLVAGAVSFAIVMAVSCIAMAMGAALPLSVAIDIASLAALLVWGAAIILSLRQD